MYTNCYNNFPGRAPEFNRYSFEANCTTCVKHTHGPFPAPYVCSNALYRARVVFATTCKVWFGAHSRIGVVGGVIAQDTPAGMIFAHIGYLGRTLFSGTLT